MNTETISNYYNPCKICGKVASGTLLPGANPHYAGWKCDTCNTHYWLSKPDDDPTKHKRTAAHRDLVKKYSRGYCEMCLRTEDKIKEQPNQTLEAQHVIEHSHGGESTRENIWILCTPCHKYVHHVRTYFNDANSIKILIESILSSIKKSA